MQTHGRARGRSRGRDREQLHGPNARRLGHDREDEPAHKWNHQDRRQTARVAMGSGAAEMAVEAGAAELAPAPAPAPDVSLELESVAVPAPRPAPDASQESALDAQRESAAALCTENTREN